MEEDAKQHDFDQRHDGPFDRTQERPPLSIAARQESTRSEPMQDKGVMSPGDEKPHTSERPRKSVQLPRQSTDGSALPRKSTQTTRREGGRTRESFDVRRDGPYGRPSVTMARRRSSGFAGASTANLNADGRPVTAPSSPDGREPSVPNVETLMGLPTTEQSSFEPEPPPLNYNVWDRKWFVVFFWSMIIIDVVAQPIALYYGLWYGVSRDTLSANAVFSIITACLGGVSIVEYVLRFWRLWKKGSTCRVIGARRAYLDWFHWNFSAGWVVVMIELIVGTIPANPPIRLLAMPLASMLYTFGTELIIVDILRYFEVPAPCRISSVPKGAQLRPAIYNLIEDIVAVDGSGGTAYREALNKRYESSHVFRAMLRRMGVFWSIGAEGMAVVTTILVFTINHEAAYVVGWSAPFVWAGIWTLITYFYVKKKLREEKKAWAEEIAEKQEAIALGNLSQDGTTASGSG